MSKLNDVLAQTLKIPAEKITNDTAPDMVEAWDSLGHLHLISVLEEEYGVEFSMDQVESMQNVGKIREVLANCGAKDL